MKVQISFMNPKNDEISFLVLIELYVIREITSNLSEVSEEIKELCDEKLINLCNKIKNKLIKLQRIINHPDFKDLKSLNGYPWRYKKLGPSIFFHKGIYRGMSSIRLTEADRLIINI